MDYEKKYKEALELARVAAFNGHQSLMEGIFPELKESEDERIRKEIQSAIKQLDKDSTICGKKYDYNQWLAWLEKQGEHNKFRDHIQIGDKVTRNEDGMLVNLSQLKRVAKKDEKQGEPTEINPSEFDLRLNRLLKQFETLPKEELASSLSFYINVVQNNGTYKEEKQGKQETLCDKCRIEHPSHSCQDITELGRCAVEHEQKPVDKVEPKFKVGDRITKSSKKSCPVHSSIDDTICEVTEVHDTCYILNTKEGRIQEPFEWQDYYELVEPAWSEEDNWIKTKIIKVLLGCETFLTSEETNECIDWIKSIKQRLKGKS